MKDKALTAIRLMAGSYTPFLLTYWGSEESMVVDNWFKGANFPGALERLEKELLAHYGDGWTVRAVSLGRAAIQLALEALELEPGSEVLMPSFSCLGVITPVVQAGLTPVLVDIDEHMNLRYESVIEAESPKVKALIISHLSGCWARDTKKIINWARQRGVWVIEDACQAQGLWFEGRPAGTYGDVGIFSAHGGKTILSSGGGWIITRNPKIAKYIVGRELKPEPRKLVDARMTTFVEQCAASGAEQGRKRLLGAVNSRLPGKGPAGYSDTIDQEAVKFQVHSMSGVDARLILFQLPRLNEILNARKANSVRWRTAMAQLPLTTMKLLPGDDNVFTKMLVMFPDYQGEGESEILRQALLKCGVETELSYTPLHLRPPYDKCRRTSMDFTNYRWRGAVSVPSRPNLADADWKRISRGLAAAKSALLKTHKR